MSRGSGLSVMLALVVVACAEEPGRFRVELGWPSSADAPPVLFLRATVELGGGGSVNSDVVGPVAFGDGVRLRFDDVPNGRGHVLTIRVTESRDAGVVYLYGRSDPFELAPGKTTTVRVPLGFQRPPQTVATSVRIESDGGFVASPDVQLELASDTGVSVVLSNRSDFSDGGAEIDLATAESRRPSCPPTTRVDVGRDCRYGLAWDLNDGLADDCAESDSCPRQVFAQFVDLDGFRSTLTSTTVVLDTRTPSLVSQSVSPEVADRDDPILVQLTFQERLRSDDVVLETALPSATVSQLFPPAGSGTLASNFTFVLRPSAGAWPDEIDAAGASLQVTAQDRAGNRTSPPLEVFAAPQVDGTTPRPFDIALAPDVLGAGARTATLTFRLAEARAPEEVVLVTTPIVDRDGAVRGTLAVDGTVCTTRGELDAATDDYRWSCPLDLSSFDLVDLDQTVPVVIRVTDPAGNLGSDSTVLRIDTREPSVTRGSLVLVPSTANPLNRVTSAGPDTELLVTLGFSEPLDVSGTEPELIARFGDAEMVFELASPLPASPTSADFRVVVNRALHPDGVYRPEVRLRDLAGNTVVTSTVPLAGGPIVVDTSSDTLTLQQDAISFVRIPIGNAADEDLEDALGNVVFTLPAGPAYYALAPADPLEPVAQLEADVIRFSGGERSDTIRIWADPERQRLLGTASPESDGRWDRRALRLVNQDATRVYLTGIDDAGNESLPVPVRTTWFVGSTASPVGLVSPHRVQTFEREKPPLVLGDEVESPAALDAPDGDVVRRSANRVWEPVGLESPPSRNHHIMAFDAARGRHVMFGGFSNEEQRDFGDTWEYDGRRWVQAQPGLSRPEPRSYPRMAYDSRRGRVVLYGGFGAGFFADTWEYDGDGWAKIATDSEGPQLTAPEVAFDSVGRRVLMFGGTRAGQSSQASNELWAWDGASWTVVSPSSTVSPGRQEHGFAFDPIRNESVAFAGVDGDGDPIEGTWVFDGFAWTQAATASPDLLDIRRAPRSVFDWSRERVITFGGYRGSFGNRVTDLAAWTGSRWEAIDAVGSPAARSRYAMSYDSVRSEVVLFSGVCDGGPCRDTWVLRGDEWIDLTPSERTPGPRSFSTFAYDPALRSLILFGGSTTSPSALDDELWEYDGRSWVERNSVDRPQTREGEAYAFDRT